MAQKNLSTKQKNTDMENRFVVSKGLGRDGWEAGVTRCKLLYTEWRNNKILLYSTESHIQHPVTNHNGKTIKRKVCAQLLSHAQLSGTPWTVAHQASLSTGILQARIVGWKERIFMYN